MLSKYVVIGKERSGKTSFIHSIACKEHRELIKRIIGSETRFVTEYKYYSSCVPKIKVNLRGRNRIDAECEFTANVKKYYEDHDKVKKLLEDAVGDGYVHVYKDRSYNKRDTSYYSYMLEWQLKDDDTEIESLKRLLNPSNDSGLFALSGLIDNVEISLTIDERYRRFYDHISFLTFVDTIPLSDTEEKSYLNSICLNYENRIIIVDYAMNNMQNEMLLGLLKEKINSFPEYKIFYILNGVDLVNDSKRGTNRIDNLKLLIEEKGKEGYFTSCYSNAFSNNQIKLFLDNMMCCSDGEDDMCRCMNSDAHRRLGSADEIYVRTESKYNDYLDQEEEVNIRLSEYIDKLVAYYDCPVKLYASLDPSDHYYIGDINDDLLNSVNTLSKYFCEITNNQGTQDTILRMFGDEIDAKYVKPNFFREDKELYYKKGYCIVRKPLDTFWRNMIFFYRRFCMDNRFFPFVDNGEIDPAFIGFCFDECINKIRYRDEINILLKKKGGELLDEHIDKEERRKKLFSVGTKLCSEDSMKPEIQGLKDIIINSFWDIIKKRYEQFRSAAIKNDTFELLNKIAPNGINNDDQVFDFSEQKKRLYEADINKIREAISDTHKDIKSFIYRIPNN